MKTLQQKLVFIRDINIQKSIKNLMKATLIISITSTTVICAEKAGKSIADAVESIWEAGNHRKPTEWISQEKHRTPSEWMNQTDHRSPWEWLNGTPSRNSPNTKK